MSRIILALVRAVGPGVGFSSRASSILRPRLLLRHEAIVARAARGLHCREKERRRREQSPRCLVSARFLLAPRHDAGVQGGGGGVTGADDGPSSCGPLKPPSGRGNSAGATATRTAAASYPGVTAGAPRAPVADRDVRV
jgi:hypothetical protein